jgi:hypothetical protein
MRSTVFGNGSGIAVGVGGSVEVGIAVEIGVGATPLQAPRVLASIAKLRMTVVILWKLADICTSLSQLGTDMNGN